MAMKSGGAPPHSKTQASDASTLSRPRYGVRQCSGAFDCAHRVSVAEVPDASEEHRHVALVRGGDHFLVAD
jgi:hypothetical protein